MHGIMQSVRNVPFTVSCPCCRRETSLTVSRAKRHSELACPCGYVYNPDQLITEAAETARRMKNTIRAAGYR